MPDAELVSPVAERIRFRGRDENGVLPAAASAVLDGIEYHTRVRNGSTAALFHRARPAAEARDEAQLIRVRDIRIVPLAATPSLRS